MNINERSITVADVYKELEEVQKELKETKEQNKIILAKLENMQESNALFHTGFATIFETLQIVEEVRRKKELGEMLNAGSVANLFCADQWKEKSMKKKINKCNVIKATPEEVNEIFDFLKSLTAKNK